MTWKRNSLEDFFLIHFENVFLLKKKLFFSLKPKKENILHFGFKMEFIFFSIRSTRIKQFLTWFYLFFFFWNKNCIWFQHDIKRFFLNKIFYPKKEKKKVFGFIYSDFLIHSFSNMFFFSFRNPPKNNLHLVIKIK